ncbi:hypothetical protein QYE76_014299 [Lolium multiflorum]|uniref:DUF4218 domain-containing protein n=1 Tax=Lolium multiflorum TaxID=4521 RepID=A0AAD8U4J2_LOLMU|nr:hypothetical protein QYE76_014299 [Lolium multiflorum]
MVRDHLLMRGFMDGYRWEGGEDDYEFVHGMISTRNKEGGEHHVEDPGHDQDVEDPGDDHDHNVGDPGPDDEEDQDGGHHDDHEDEDDGPSSMDWVQDPYLQELLLKQTSNARAAAREKAKMGQLESVGVRQLRRLQEEIVVILCELEMYFPPAFFDVMVHLLVHIVEDIIQLGPTFLHSMMPFERMNGVIKGYVRNRARPDGA